MREPRSIFTGTGNDSTTALDRTPDQRQLDTCQQHHFVAKTPDPPPAPLNSPFEFPDPHDPWARLSPTPSNNHHHLHQRSGSAPLQRRPPHSGTQSALAPPAIAGIKRSPPSLGDYPLASISSRLAPPQTEPLHKRRRALPPLRYSLDRFTLSKAAQSRLPTEPLSPLFFSSRTIRLNLPPRFSSSEAAASMLSKTHEESNIKTVTLARGTYSSLSPPGPPPGAGGRSSERSSLPRTASPDTREKSDPLRILASIGIVELLEHDGRPTFIVDIGESTSRTPQPTTLHILFANNALRSNPSAWELVAGKSPASTPQDSIVNATHQFRAWLLDPTHQSQGSHTSPLPVDYGGILWSCFTLRKRLRVVSGHVSAPATILPSTHVPDEVAMPMLSAVAHASGNGAAFTSPPPRIDEAQDYFGSAGPATPRKASTSPIAAPQPDPTYSKLGHKTMVPDLPSRINLTSIEESAPFVNQCVLRAHVAGDVDPFYRENDEVGEEVRDMGFFDWTRLAPSPTLPKHIQFARSIDWASTPLGPIEYWSNDLRAMCNLIMASPHPAAMYWGEELVAIYNEAYIGLAGQKHPALMGQSYRVAWAEIWHEVKDVFANARLTGQATMKDDDCLFIWRNGFIEEAYFSWSIIPMVGEDGTVMGLYNPAFEKTRRKVAERRMLTLREVGERTATAREIKGFWDQVLLALTENDFDTPIVMLYSVNDENDSDSSSLHSSSLLGSKQCYLEGSLGVPAGHQAAPDQIDLKDGQEGFGPVFREVMKTDKPAVVSIGSDDLPASMMEGIEWRGFGDPCREIVICPIHPTQLAARTQEALESETRFTRMAELSPAGLFIADHVGRITYCNDTWYEIARVPREPEMTDRWIEYVRDEDQPLILEHWERLVNDTTPINLEFRFKAPWEDRDRTKSDTWVLFSAFPEKDEHGQLKSVFGSITNISPQKWAEGFQKRKMEEAVELKRQQENFIDITSHEMRNPLSAILQCADEISTILGDFRASGSQVIEPGIVADSIDAAQTIALCAQHQKRIVDDVLTLSKLDSAMLMVTPVDAQPLQVVQRALKMFEGEVQTAGIQMEFVLTDSFTSLGVDWVKIDPSRVLQVLINLTTNAIKFTTTEETRTIKVVLSASRERPSARSNPTVNYFPMRAKRIDQTCGPDWGDGEEIFLEFAVQDTGRGLTPEEKKLLFQRFSQASPRTHVQYGGSGLGLFISRELTELQGGEIGVSSEAGKGSTFAFYVKCRRSIEPKDTLEVLPVSLSRKVSNAKDKGRTGMPVPSQSKTITKDFAIVPKQDTVTPKPQPKKEIKVLIVEDNLVNQRVLQRQLQNQGIQTIVANHGGEALEVLKLSTFWASPSSPTTTATPPTDISVVLMDKEMPVMDGLQCTSRIRELEQHGKFKCHVPIIAVTANARSEQIATLLAAGMDDVVSKPFRIGELIPKIEDLANRFGNKKPVSDDAALKVLAGPSVQPYGV
uniref:Putative histidine kinase HHK13p n=1 Tax=Cochliobolus heterostrophus TaxID=5016 RepID=Q6SLD4_COCHE|nr:putative histidine kinase HHK13p [Bipolaris maydis]